MFTFQDVNLSAHTDHIIQCSGHHPFTWQNIKTRRQHISTSSNDYFKSLKKNHNHPLYDWPCNFNGPLQFFGVPKNQGILSWNASQQDPHTNQPKHTLWEEFMVVLDTSKLLIIPPINHQNQLLNRNFASLSTLRSGFSYTSIRNKDLKTNLQQPPWILKPKTTLLICIVVHPSAVAPQDFHRAHFT
jgi:hypothetical protein